MPHPSKKSKDNVVDVEPVKTTKDDREKFRTQEERRSEKFAIPIDESQYPQGNFDVVSAARAAELTVRFKINAFGDSWFRDFDVFGDLCWRFSTTSLSLLCMRPRIRC
jgi:hypothetical protein